MIKIENITDYFEEENYSLLDVKIGQSFITNYCKTKGEKAIKIREEKAKHTTSPEFGFNIIGYQFKEPSTG